MKLFNLTTSTLVAGLMVGSAASAATIFQDDFSGDTADLNGASTDLGAGTWIAANGFDSNGNFNSTDAGPGTATLAFTPTDGLIYTAEASVSSIGPSSTGSWIGFGFATGQSTDSITGNRFLNNQTIGRAWMFARGNSNNPLAAMDGVDDNAVWNGFDESGETQSPANVDMRIVLDTTAGAGNWTATWFAKDSADANYTEVRSETDLLTESIDSVGFALASDAVTGTITDFSLTQVPEPGSLALLGLGGLLIARRRRG